MSCSNSAHACCSTVRIWTCASRPPQQLVRRLVLAGGVEADEQVPAGVAEAALARGLPTHVAVVVDDDLVVEQVGHGLDVAVHVGDHPDPDLVGDLAQRVGERRRAVDRAGGLGRERRHRLRAAGHAQVVDAGVVEDRGHQRTNWSAASRSAGCCSAYSRTAEPPGSLVSRARSVGPRGRRLEVRRQGRGDDVAGLEVAVRRGPVRLARRRTARRRRRRRRPPGPRPPAARSCGRPSPRPTAAPARRAAAASARPGGRSRAAAGRRSPTPRAARPARSARSAAARGPGRACSCTSASGPAGTAPPSPGAGRPRSRGAPAPSAGSCRARAGPRSGRRAGCSRNSGLPVLDGWAPASKRAKSLFSAASAGRLPVALVTISGASIATRQSPSTYGSSAATISSSVPRPTRAAGGRRRRGRPARWACGHPRPGRLRRSAWGQPALPAPDVSPHLGKTRGRSVA